MLILPAGQAEAQRARRAVLPPIPSAAIAEAKLHREPFLPDPGPRPAASEMVGAVPLAENVELGIGRFSVLEIARPRTHVETDRSPTDIRLRDRGIAGMGVKLSF
ncbi:MAG TPA: hypothetical protein VGX37_01580 [Allosphingosinicella sp.]|nr:hypothetical protein [Allosphingosinicella sp.]